MKKKLFLIITGFVLVGTVCIWLLAKNKPAGQMLVDLLNETVSHYMDMNIKDDETYSLKVSDVQMLVTTYARNTAESSGIGTPVRVENIINVDFTSKENVICRLFLYENGRNILLSRQTMEYIQSQKRIMI